MNFKKIGLITILSIVVIAVLFLFKRQFRANGNFSVERVYNDSLVLLKNTEVNQLGLMQYKDNKLFFVSWKEAHIVKFDIEKWGVEQIYGRKGKGPTENINISSFEVKDSTFITYDQGKKSVQEVTFKDSLVYYHSFTTPLTNSVKVGNNFLLSGSDNSELRKMIFTWFSLEDSKINKIEVDSEILQNKYSEMIYHGIFTKNDFYEVYVTLYNDVFFVFNNKFKYQYTSNMIYDVAEPRFEYRNGYLVPDRSNIDVNQHAFLDNNNLLYIISNIYESNEKNRFRNLDLYDIENKTYVSSIKVPDLDGEKVGEIIRKENILYALYPNSVAAYEIIEQN